MTEAEFMRARKLRLNQVARRLSVSVATVKRLIYYGELAAVRVGRRAWAVAETDLEQFVRSRSNRADEEV